jgi:hypothetical protein
MRFPRIILLSVSLALLALCAVGQSPNGNVNGLVLDPSNRVIAGAEVIAVNDLTNLQFTTKTNVDGVYVLPNLPPGPYRLQVSKTGFKTLIKPDIVLNVQDALSINFTLPIGAVFETLTVEGGAPLVNTESASVSTVVDRQFAENLPMNGRSFQTLIYLTPGVVVTPTSDTASGQFSVNGQRTASNYWMVDGVSANTGVGASTTPGNGFGGTVGSFSALGGTNGLVSVDAMQEFRIQTSSYAPEFGRTPGGQISIITRSGTNQFHGTVFDYLRNDAFDANNWFNTSVSPRLPKAQERQNDFGGTFNGPIVKDRTFFFFSYEGLRLRLPRTISSDVPDASFTPGGTTNSRQAATPAMRPYLDAFPLPNRTSPEIFAACDPNTDPTCPPAGRKPTGSAQFNASYSNPGSLDAYSLRIDHRLNDRWNLFGRYNNSPSELVVRGGTVGSGALSIEEPFRIATQTVTVGTTWASSAAVTNDLRFNYSRTKANSYFFLDDFGGAVPLGALPFPSGDNAKNSQFLLDIFGLGVGGELADGKNAQNIQRQVNLVDGLSWQKGPHSLKFGVDFRRLSPSHNSLNYGQVALFSDVPNTQTGNAVGEIQSLNGITVLFHNLGAYAQDTWRALPRLTITYGVRWDVDFAPSSQNGPNLPAVTGYNLADLAGLAVAPAGTPPFKTTYGNVAPRLGAAYQLSDNQTWQRVLRGGFGVFYDLVSAETGNVTNNAFPPFGNFTEFGPAAFPFSPAQIAPLPIPPSATLANLYVFNPKSKLPYTLEWNVALEQSLGKERMLSVSYVGAAGRRLLQTTEVFAPPANPNVGLADFIDNTAASNYQALQLQFQQRLSRGLQVLTSYTWSHSIDDTSSSYVGNAFVPGDNNLNRANSDFDIRHGLTAGLTYDIPAPHGKTFAGAVTRGWSADTFILARSAPPVDLNDSNFRFLEGGFFTNIRPDVVPGESPYLYRADCASTFRALGELVAGQTCPGGMGFNPAAFTNPPTDPNTGNPTRQGNLPRNFLRGFGATEWDFALHRDFPIWEQAHLQFRAEIFNLLNHPNFGPPYPFFGGTGFGLSNQTLAQSFAGSGSLGGGGFNPLYQIGGPRSIQLALKLLF